MKSTSKVNSRCLEEKDSVGYTAMIEPTYGGALAVSQAAGLTGTDGVMEALVDLKNQFATGDLGHQEELLLIQSELLHTVCVDFAMRIKGTNSPEVMKLFAAIAFKAQNQARRTITALADLRSPKRTTFIKQQNNAVNQQVNNTDEAGTAGLPESAKAAPELKNLENIPANELMEDLNDVQRMDAGAPAEAVRRDTAVETLGAVHGAEKC